jgi:cell fate regulator YaaT (PSP1 superfamily)
VVITPEQVVSEEISEPLDPVIRPASPEDLAQEESLKENVHEDLKLARKKVEEHGLDMRIVGAESNLEGSHLTLYFTAQQRVDFRSLVRDVSSAVNKRVQLLQVGDRDRAKLAGDMGPCGYVLCCRSWLTAFPSISIRMAKDQDVPLNPSKISGVCGRLLCCLAFEHEQYRELRGKLPKIGQMLSTPAGEAKLVAVHVLKQTVSLRMSDTLNVVEMPMEELRSQYGTAVRPAELVKQELAPRPAADAPAETRSPEATAPDQGEDHPRRRRRRRGGRGRRNSGPTPDQPPPPA